MFYRLTTLYVVVLAGVACSYEVDGSVYHKAVQQGHTAELVCVADRFYTNMAWVDDQLFPLNRNETRLIDDERVSVSKVGREWYLSIKKVNISDAGDYYCTFYGSSVQQKKYYLIVFVPPEIDEGSSSPDVEATEGTSVRLFCNATGYPKPNVTWTSRRSNEEKNSSNVKVIAGPSSTIRISNVSRYLDEIYTCTASNGFGRNDSLDIRVRVRFKPTVRVHQRTYVRQVGEQVTLTCEGQGYQIPKMYFAKDGLEIFDDSFDYSKYRYTKRIHGHDIQITLDIYNLEENDFGRYKCAAINTLGKAEDFTEVTELRAREKLNSSSNPLQSGAQGKRSTSPDIHRIPGAKTLASEPKQKGGGPSTHPTLLLTVCVAGFVMML